MTYRHRIIEARLTEFLQNYSAVGLTGPRQSGKSTLLKQQLKDYRYVTKEYRGDQSALINQFRKHTPLLPKPEIAFVMPALIYPHEIN